MNSSNTYLHQLHRQGDRMMLGVVAALAAAALALAPWYHTWVEALVVALPTAALVAWLALSHPGALVTRCAGAAALMVMTALHIHQAHGLVESHFGVFVLLAFLLVYRDWVPLVVAAGVIAVHHVSFFLLQHSGAQVWVFAQGSGFGIVLLHAAYVVFETGLLVYMAIGLKAEITAVGAEPAALARISQELARGNVAVEVPTAGAEPSSLAHAMADMRLSLAQAVTSTGEVLRAVASGDLSRRVTVEASGEFARLQQNVNHTVDFLAAFSTSQQVLVRRANAGDFTGRCPTQGLRGFQLELADGLNQLAGSVESFVTDFAAAQAALAAGDLSRPIAHTYAGRLEDLRLDTNRTLQQLAGIVGRIHTVADSIAVATQHIAHGNADLTARSGEQADALRQTAGSVGNLASVVQDNARNAGDASKLSLEASEAAARGGEAVREVIATMQGISTSSRRIADITGVIEEIAFQTNLLALNAAVEAARAGEQGRGFAVVASEVRALAGRAATAAREIKELIAESVQRIEQGADQVGRAGDTVQEVVSSIDAVTRIIGDLAVSSREQSAGIGQVNESITQLAHGTDANLNIVREAAVAAERMTVEAEALRESVMIFKLAPPTAQRQEPQRTLRAVGT